jgi:aldose 1-epimerase
LVVTYEWTDDNELKIKYQATADKQTVASFTNHAYFNLSAGECAIFDHTLKVYAENMLDVDATYVPTGLVKPAGKRVLNGEVLREKMIAGGDTINGYNHCFVLQNDAQHTLKTAALLIDSTSGRRVEVATSYPSIVVYTGDYLQSKIPGNYSRSYRPFDGLCLECQHYPDSPNHAHFPSATLGPGEAFHQVIVYKFGVVA